MAACRRLAWPIVLLGLVSAVAAGLFAADRFAVNTDTTEMIAEDLEFRQDYRTYKDAFNRLRDPIVVVIDGATADLADRAADRLAAALNARPSLFEVVDRTGGGPFFERNGLLYLDVDELYDLGDRLAAAQPLLAELNHDPSLRGFFGVLADAADEVAEDDAEPQAELATVFDSLRTAVEAELAGRPHYFSWQEIMAGADSDLSDRRRFIVVQPVQDFSDLQPSKTAIKEVRRLVDELALSADNGVTVRLTGSAVITDEELRGLSDDAGLAGIVSFVLVALILFGGLRSPQVAVAALLTVFVGLVWTAAFATAAIGSFNLISIAFAVLFIGLSVDLAIHFGLRFREGLDDGEGRDRALSGAARDVGWALALCVVTDAIAFFSFVPTAYIGISELGIIAGTGMVIALFATMTLMPALLRILPARPGRPGRAGRPDSIAVRADGVIRRHAVLLAILAAAVAVGAVAASTQARFDFDPINLRDPDTEGVLTFRELQEDPDTATYTIKVMEPSLDAAVPVAERIETLPTVKDAITLASFVPSDQDEKLDVIDGLSLALLPVIEPVEAPLPPPDDGARVEALRELAGSLRTLSESPLADFLAEPARDLAAVLDDLDAAALRTPGILESLERTVMATFPAQIERLRTSLRAQHVTLDDLPQTLRDQYLADDGRARIEVRPSVADSDPAAMAAFVRDVRTVAPHATGGPVLIVESGNAVIDAFILASIIAMIAATLFLVSVLRSVVDTLLILVPLGLAGLMTFAAAALIGQPFNFANIIVLPLMIGLGVDSGIHMVIRERFSDAGRSLMETSTPRAVVLSALTTVCSFGTLALSSHQGTASMGWLLMVALANTLIATLVVLPALLALKQRWRPAVAS